MNNSEIIAVKNIEQKIYTIRGKQVMIDENLADLYGIETKYLNRAVKRNPDRFPEAFMFQLTKEEYDDLRFQIGTTKPDNPLRFQSGTLKTGRGQHRKYLPYVFTEQGVAMLSAVLKTETAVKTISRALQQDANKFNTQYGGLTLHKFSVAHDRFLLIDKTEVYHLGASLKDLGKRWFAFSKMDKNSLIILKKLGV